VRWRHSEKVTVRRLVSTSRLTIIET